MKKIFNIYHINKYEKEFNISKIFKVFNIYLIKKVEKISQVERTIKVERIPHWYTHQNGSKHRFR